MRKSGGIQSPRRTRLLKDVNTIRHFDMPKCPPVFLFSFQHSKVSLNQQKKKKQQQQSWWTRKGVNRVTWKKKEKNVIVLRAFSFWNEVAVLDLSYWKIRMMRTFFSRFFFLLFSTQNKRGGKSPQTFGNLTRCYKEGKKQTRNKISRWFVCFFFFGFFFFGFGFLLWLVSFVSSRRRHLKVFYLCEVISKLSNALHFCIVSNKTIVVSWINKPRDDRNKCDEQ